MVKTKPFMVCLGDDDLAAIETIKAAHQVTMAGAARLAIIDAFRDRPRVSEKLRKAVKAVGGRMTTLRLNEDCRSKLAELQASLRFDSEAETLRFCLRVAAIESRRYS